MRKLTVVAACLLFAGPVSAQGPGSLIAAGPSGVKTIDPDGGMTYYGNNGFTSAAASITFKVDGRSVAYASGWDDPKFFPLGWWNEYLPDAAHARTWVASNTNTAWVLAAPWRGQLNLAKANGISNIIAYQSLGQVTLTDRAPGTETVGILTWDEPACYETGWVQAMQGYPAATFRASASGGKMTVTSAPSPSTVPVLSEFGYAARLLNVPFLHDGGIGIAPNTTSVLYNTSGVCGNLIGDTYHLAGGSPSFSSSTITQKAQPGLDAVTADTRFSWMNLTNGFLRFHAIGSQFCPGAGAPMCNGPNLQASWMMSNKVPAPSGKTRKLDMIGVDIYWFVEGQCQNIYGSNCNQTLSNVYDINATSPAMTLAQAARGTHYGDMADIERSFMTPVASGGNGTVPIHMFLEASNCICNVSYDVQPVEVNWAVWGSIIHGVRAIGYFGQYGGQAMSGCNGAVTGDALYCTYSNTAQSVSITGSISGNTLTVTGAPRGSGRSGGGQLGPGMQATSGVTGASTILQQTQVGLLGAPASFTATFSGTNHTTMTVSGVNGTIQVPSILNGVAVDFNGCDAANCGSAIPNFQHIKITGGSGPTYTVDPNLVSAGSHAVTSYPVVTARASFSGVNQTTMTISDASGTVPVPAQLFGQNVGGRSSVYGGGNAIVRSGSGPYTVDPNTITPGPVTIIPIPGAQGLYKVSGGTGSGSMTYRQYGWGGGTYSGYGPSGPTHLIGGITATNSFVATMAPVINSKFAAGFLASQSPDRYMFERGMTQNCNTGSMTQSLQSFACGIATGIDSMVKYYQGSSYTAPTGDTISPGFYLFATTANPETDTAIGATFNFVSDCGVSTATVIGENRSIPISGCSFSDMFQNAWTTHIYKLQ